MSIWMSLCAQEHWHAETSLRVLIPVKGNLLGRFGDVLVMVKCPNRFVQNGKAVCLQSVHSE